MSYHPGEYIPPPPIAQRRSTSPWVYIGVGCLALFLLTVVGGGLVVYNLGKAVTKAMSAPPNKEQQLASIAGVPVYPGATYDDQSARIAQVTIATMSTVMGKNIGAAGFRSDAAPDAIESWYDAQMTKNGFTISKARENPVNDQVTHQYQKQSENVTVLTQPDRFAGKGTTLVLMKMTLPFGAASPAD